MVWYASRTKRDEPRNSGNILRVPPSKKNPPSEIGTRLLDMIRSLIDAAEASIGNHEAIAPTMQFKTVQQVRNAKGQLGKATLDNLVPLARAIHWPRERQVELVYAYLIWDLSRAEKRRTGRWVAGCIQEMVERGDDSATIKERLAGRWLDQHPPAAQVTDTASKSRRASSRRPAMPSRG